jgi:hypothetical protein
MLAQLFPEKPDNAYRGALVAKWAFIVMVVMTIARSLAHILLPDGGAQSIATIPLDSFSPGASAVVIGMFAQWGLTQLMSGLLYVIVLWRYQSLIPLMWLFIVFEWLGRLLLSLYKPFETAGTAPGGIGNMIIPVLALLMLMLSLRDHPPSHLLQE